jgi:hypothetical protein
MFDVPPPNEVRGTIVVVFSSRSGLAAPPVAKDGRPKPKTTGRTLRDCVRAPRCSYSGIRTATATESSSETERRGQAALGRAGLPVVHSGHRTAAAYATSRSASSRGRLSVM